MNRMTTGAALMLLATSAWGGTPCDQVKAGIDEKIRAKGVPSFTLEVVDNGAATGGKVVGSCEGGSKQIVYTRGGEPAATPAATPAPAPAPATEPAPAPKG